MSKEEPHNPKHYTPILQKPACCVPTTLQMILKRRGLKSYDQEYLGNLMGLVVPVHLKKHFKKVATAKKTPPHGWGTHIDIEQYSLDSIFTKLDLPLKAEFRLVDKFNDVADFKKTLMQISNDPRSDAMLCVQSGYLEGDTDPVNGHVILLAAADNKNVYYIDPGSPEEGSIKTTYSKLLRAMQRRGPKDWGGVWQIRQV